jgi:hypothetical protein
VSSIIDSGDFDRVGLVGLEVLPKTLILSGERIGAGVTWLGGNGGGGGPLSTSCIPCGVSLDFEDFCVPPFLVHFLLLRRFLR